jgi:NAD+ kinase
VNLVGIVLKDKSERAKKASTVLIDYLSSRSIEYFVLYSKRGELSASIEKRIPECNLTVAFGGDGTLLFAARVFSRYDVPIVGINLGGLGFITEFREEEVLECVECFLQGHHDIESRMMIDVRVTRGGETVQTMTGLNDLVISSGGISRLLEFEVSSGSRFIGSYRADGIIVATPTGSTGYSLAAGGPIVDPSMTAFIISPICPHSLGARPLVVPSREVIRVRVLSKGRSVTSTVDGQIAFELSDADEVQVLQSKQVTRLISVGKRSFYDIVREKLAWKG